jgi:hypothetical protein
VNLRPKPVVFTVRPGLRREETRYSGTEIPQETEGCRPAMYDTAEPEADDPPAATRALDELTISPPPLLRLAGDGDDDECEPHICRGID